MLRGKLDAFRNKQIILLDKSLKEKANFYPTKRPHLRFLARNINEDLTEFIGNERLFSSINGMDNCEFMIESF